MSDLCMLFFAGPVNIACCTGSNYTDSTSVSWISDYSWFPDKTSCHDITNTAYKGQNRVRVFDIDSGKRCYNLQTTQNQEYLIRAIFLSDNPQGALGSYFDVSIGASSISKVNLSKDLEVEGIFRARNQYTDFCLVQHIGYPRISQLQLRPLGDTTYLQNNASNVLKLVSRIDVGNTGEDIRYPDDPYDRIWKSPDSLIISGSSPTRANTTVYNATTTVPLKVLHTALTHTERLVFLHNDLDAVDHNYTVILYFLELDDAVKTGQRVFDIYVNNKIQKGEFDILANDNGSNYREVSLDVIANGSLNLTLVKITSSSGFGPILNAYEVLQVNREVQGTNQQDVDTMRTVKYELMQHNHDNEILQSWSGDPCLPVPWDGLACSNSGGSSTIIKLNVSSRQLHGPIPSSIFELTNLKTLDLSHNELTGFLPDNFTSLPLLTTLYFGCNHLSKDLPTGFNSSKLTTEYESHPLQLDIPIENKGIKIENSNPMHLIFSSGLCVGQVSESKRRVVIATIACGSFLLTLAVGLVFVQIYKKKIMNRGSFDWKQHPMTKNAVFSVPSSSDVIFKSIAIEMFSLACIERATQKYKTLIGEGGFGSVYRGTLSDGQEVAVKVRSSTSAQGTREFENELNLLSSIRHENLVPLLGYCCENDQQILVYPFMSNGSLQDRLYGEAAKRKTLDWPTRLSIALGAARGKLFKRYFGCSGLTHLHTFAGRCVIHRDVKSSNILLDHGMNAKVADFGFSKYAPQEGDSGASLEVRGTAGYLDPEYYSTQHLSAKSDVFSFGVVLLEIVSGREPLNIRRPRNEWSLVEWAKPYIRESKIDEIVDPSIKGGYHAEAMWRVVEVALACIEPFSAYRPCMADIVRELEDALIIENNASEYMRSIDSLYSTGGSNRFSIVMEKKMSLPPPIPTPTEPSPINGGSLAPPEPR
ncbi:hypothetical protein Tsubulata_009267 [Turnera subulata]|uniref:non-specific serine/threonine protein kinase n=1 Tax=Turnera subulata TaxID=218843 RepID=A0A9Q0G1U2_9ROSI|nr:hypothetical protein Tsubulata_009267 [Turnera subulata]